MKRGLVLVLILSVLLAIPIVYAGCDTTAGGCTTIASIPNNNVCTITGFEAGQGTMSCQAEPTQEGYCCLPDGPATYDLFVSKSVFSQFPQLSLLDCRRGLLNTDGTCDTSGTESKTGATSWTTNDMCSTGSFICDKPPQLAPACCEGVGNQFTQDDIRNAEFCRQNEYVCGKNKCCKTKDEKPIHTANYRLAQKCLMDEVSCGSNIDLVEGSLYCCDYTPDAEIFFDIESRETFSSSDAICDPGFLLCSGGGNNNVEALDKKKVGEISNQCFNGNDFNECASGQCGFEHGTGNVCKPGEVSGARSFTCCSGIGESVRPIDGPPTNLDWSSKKTFSTLTGNKELHHDMCPSQKPVLCGLSYNEGTQEYEQKYCCESGLDVNLNSAQARIIDSEEFCPVNTVPCGVTGSIQHPEIDMGITGLLCCSISQGTGSGDGGGDEPFVPINSFTGDCNENQCAFQDECFNIDEFRFPPNLQGLEDTGWICGGDADLSGYDFVVEKWVDCSPSTLGQISPGGAFKCERISAFNNEWVRNVEICTNFEDDDGDGKLPRNDEDCLGQICGIEGSEWTGSPGFMTCSEIHCEDGIDNNDYNSQGDGSIDCQDATCEGYVVEGPNGGECEPVEQTCNDGFDNDGDEDRSTCEAQKEACEAACPIVSFPDKACTTKAGIGEACNDNNDCFWQPGPLMGDSCFQGKCIAPIHDINVLDPTLTSCEEDSDCTSPQSCKPVGIGFLRRDAECINDCQEEFDRCAPGTDCKDTDCIGLHGPENGAFCCFEDADCGNNAVCMNGQCEEMTCSNGIDDDGDGLTDCEEAVCEDKVCGGSLSRPSYCQSLQCQQMPKAPVAQGVPRKIIDIFTYDDIIALLHTGIVEEGSGSSCQEICPVGFNYGIPTRMEGEQITRCTCYDI